MILRWLILGPRQKPILSHSLENQIFFFDCIYLASCSIPICSFLFQNLSRQLECKIKKHHLGSEYFSSLSRMPQGQEMISQFLLAFSFPAGWLFWHGPENLGRLSAKLWMVLYLQPESPMATWPCPQLFCQEWQPIALLISQLCVFFTVSVT